MLLTHSGGKVFSPFAAVGTMMRSLHSAHCIVLMLEVLDEERSLMSLWIQVNSFMLFTMMWRSAIGKGPFEGIISKASGCGRPSKGRQSRPRRRTRPGRKPAGRWHRHRVRTKPRDGRPSPERRESPWAAEESDKVGQIQTQARAGP